MSVAAQYGRQAAGLREMSAGRQFALHLLNLQQNDPGVSTSPFYDVGPFWKLRQIWVDRVLTFFFGENNVL